MLFANEFLIVPIKLVELSGTLWKWKFHLDWFIDCGKNTHALINHLHLLNVLSLEVGFYCV